MGEFRFKRFTVLNDRAALKLGTDAVLLGASMSLAPGTSRLLDIGTGTGVIALMAAQRLEGGEFSISAIDIDEPSAEEAAVNFAASPWAAHLESEALSLRDFARNCDRTFDHIFSNPPYYDLSLKNPDSREAVARHCESLSYREICAFASSSLVPGGRLSLILPSDAERSLLRTAASFGLYPFRLLRIRTTPAKPIKRIVAEFSTGRTLPCEEELVLQNENGRSAEYTALTAAFYL